MSADERSPEDEFTQFRCPRCGLGACFGSSEGRDRPDRVYYCTGIEESGGCGFTFEGKDMWQYMRRVVVFAFASRADYERGTA